jgi:hypothetical protein
MTTVPEVAEAGKMLRFQVLCVRIDCVRHVVPCGRVWLFGRGHS